MQDRTNRDLRRGKAGIQRHLVPAADDTDVHLLRGEVGVDQQVPLPAPCVTLPGLPLDGSHDPTGAFVRSVRGPIGCTEFVQSIVGCLRWAGYPLLAYLCGTGEMKKERK